MTSCREFSLQRWLLVLDDDRDVLVEKQRGMLLLLSVLFCLTIYVLFLVGDWQLSYMASPVRATGTGY